MSLSSGPAGGKGVDSSAVDTYDSGDEWDIGVGNLIIDLDADLEKDKLEMSSSKEGGGMAAPPSAVAALPDNIKFVSPVAAMQGKESKSKSKRSKNSKDQSIKAAVSDGAKKEVQGRGGAEPPAQNPASTPTKGGDKCSKTSRTLPAVKKDKELVSGKAKKDKVDAVGSGADEAPAGASCIGPFEGQQNAEHAAAKQPGVVALDPSAGAPSVAMATDQEAEDADCRHLKKGGGAKVGIIIAMGCFQWRPTLSGSGPVTCARIPGPSACASCARGDGRGPEGLLPCPTIEAGRPLENTSKIKHFLF